MIISRFGKSYDTANGSEQPFGAARKLPGRGQPAVARWEDDGGPVVQPTAALIVGRKPSWSVLSLEDLNEALRRAGDPVRAHEESQQLERAQAATVARAAARAAAAALAHRDRHRNAWENF